MQNPALLEACYKKYINDISKWLPDGMIQVDLEVLHKLGLLQYHDYTGRSKDSLKRYFHVIESEEKLTLANDQFIVWIVPEKSATEALTYTLIALNKENEIPLELAFVTKGIYNHSHLVLSLLERFLLEIQHTEELLTKLK